MGEQTKEVYERWVVASGNRSNLRYLARFETSNADLFQHASLSKRKIRKILDHRLECLEVFKRMRLPGRNRSNDWHSGQTLKDLCMDIRMFQQVDADMIGMGPYLMSEEADLESLGQMENKALFQLSLNMIAVTRLVMGQY